MKERVKPFWFVVMTILVSITLLLSVSCGGDDDDDSNNDATGGTDGNESGTSAESGTSGGVSGSGSMQDASVDGAIFKPTSTGDVQAEGTCTTTISPFIPETISGTCKPSGTECPGGTASTSDCAQDLVCCIGVDQCEVFNGSLSGSSVGGLIQGVQCVPEGSCPGLDVMIMSIQMEFPGCPAGQACCPMFPEGGITGLLEGGLGGLFEGGLEGGRPDQQDSGVSSTDAGTSSSEDAATTTDASEQQ